MLAYRKGSRVKRLTDVTGKRDDLSIPRYLSIGLDSIGQQKPVHVYQLIAENTVEAKVSRCDPLQCHELRHLY